MRVHVYKHAHRYRHAYDIVHLIAVIIIESIFDVKNFPRVVQHSKKFKTEQLRF